MGDKWTLLIVRDLAAGPRRFVELQRLLPGISTEQLRSRLNRMVADELLTRKRYREMPPRVDYELTERARALMPVLGELARWGYHWAWGEPRASESIDLGAIFRLAPSLVRLEDLNATVEFLVEDQGDGGAYTFLIRDGRVTMERRTAELADARVFGERVAWVRAFSPERHRGALRIEGQQRLAVKLLNDLAAETPKVAAEGFRAAA